MHSIYDLHIHMQLAVDPDKDMVKTLTEEDAGFTKVENPDPRPMTPEVFLSFYAFLLQDLAGKPVLFLNFFRGLNVWDWDSL